MDRIDRALPRLLVVTNDFPPRVGGAQRYCHDLVRHLPPDRVTVLAPRWEGWRSFDADQRYAVIRYGGSFLRPGRDLRQRVGSLIAETGAEMVLFGHGYPLGSIGPMLDVPYATLTHGVEAWMARVPVARQLLARALARARVVFTVSHHTERWIRRALPPSTATLPLPPGVDVDRFHPDVDGWPVRERHGVGDRPLVVCVSRLVARKGQDTLLRIWPEVRRMVPEARLLLVGSGPDRERLERMAAPLGDAVAFAGLVPEEELPAHYAAADLFAMPCRDQKGGLELEGLGIVYLEAAACGKAAVAGRSGGAPEAVIEGETGVVVDGTDRSQVARAIVDLLGDAGRRISMGKAGRAWVETDFSWHAVLERFAAALRGARPSPAPRGGAG